MFRRHPVLSAVTLAYLGVVLLLTLNPSNSTEESSWLWTLYLLLERWSPALVSFDAIEFACNMLVFLPMGVFFLLLLGRRRWLVAVMFGVLGSCWIELAQYLWLSERTADVRDVLSNGLGVVVGVALAAVADRRTSRRSVTGARSVNPVPSAIPTRTVGE